MLLRMWLSAIRAGRIAMSWIMRSCFAVAAAGGLLLAAGVMAQDRGRDGDRDRDGERDRDRDRDERRQIDPREIIRMADDNNDGVIDPSEVGSRSGYYIRRAAERAGLDGSKPIPVDKILPAL